MSRARAATLATAIAGVGPVLDQLREPPATELAVLERPETAAQLGNELADVRARLATLAEADASWSVRLEDGFAALRSRTEFAFQARIASCSARPRTRSNGSTRARWPEVGQKVQHDTADAVRAAFLAGHRRSE